MLPEALEAATRHLHVQLDRTVPDVVGDSESDATAALRAQDFQVSVQREDGLEVLEMNIALPEAKTGT